MEVRHHSEVIPLDCFPECFLTFNPKAIGARGRNTFHFPNGLLYFFLGKGFYLLSSGPVDGPTRNYELGVSN